MPTRPRASVVPRPLGARLSARFGPLPAILFLLPLLFQTAISMPSLAAPGPVIDLTAAAGSGSESVAECSIAVDPSRDRVYVAGHTDGAPGDLSMHLFRSHDGGATWQLTRLNSSYDRLVLTRGDPSLAVDDLGNLYLAYAMVSVGKPYAIIVAKSLDGGVTFEPPAVVVRGNSTAVADKPYLTLGSGASGEPLVLVVFTRNEGALPGLWLSVSRDRGETFGEPVLVRAGLGVTYGMAATGRHGEIYVSFAAPTPSGEYEVQIARSDDGGSTFSLPVRLAATGMGFRHMLAAAPHRGVGSVPTIGVDSSPVHRGRVYVAWVGADREDRMDTDVFCRWADGAPTIAGMRWSEAIPVHRQDTGSNFHSWLSVDPVSGIVGVLSHATRADPSRRKVETWLSVSADGGERWSERKVSEHTTDATGQFGLTPLDYLEYIGLTMSRGTAWCAWAGTAGGDPNINHYLYRAFSVDEVLAGRTLHVPLDHETAAGALSQANAGDRIQLDGNLGPYAGPLELPWHVTLESLPGTKATIDAGGSDFALRIESGSRATARNLELKGWSDTGAGVRLETPSLSLPEGIAPPEPPDFRQPAMLEDIELDGGATGLVSEGVPVSIVDCRFEGQVRAVDLHFDDAAGASATRIASSIFVAPAEGRTASLALSMTTGVEGSPVIERNTLHGWGTPIRLVEVPAESGSGAFRPEIRRNLVTGFAGEPIDLAEVSPGFLDPVVSCNNFWAGPIAARTTPPTSASWTAAANLSVDPRYCGPGSEADDLWLRVDSPVSAGNSSCGGIGALDVRCAPPSLEEDCRLVSGTQLVLEEPLRILPGVELKVEEGCGISAAPDGAEAVAGRALIENEGILSIAGSASARVSLTASLDRDAALIRNHPGGSLTLTNATLSHVRKGILAAGSTRIAGTSFASIDSVAIGAASGLDSLVIDGCTFDMQGGTALDLTAPGGRVMVTGSRIQGASEGMKVIGGGVRVGGVLPGEGNVFSENVTAVRLLSPTTADQASCVPGVTLRGNQFLANGDAIVIEPDASPPDLGRLERGLNLFSGQEGHAVVHRHPACGPLPARGNRFGPGEVIGAADPEGSVDWSGWTVDSGPITAPLRVRAMPNPSDRNVHLQLELAGSDRRVTVDLFDFLGRRIVRLFEGTVFGNAIGFDWDGKDGEGRQVAAGLYWTVARDTDGNIARLRLLRL